MRGQIAMKVDRENDEEKQNHDPNQTQDVPPAYSTSQPNLSPAPKPIIQSPVPPLLIDFRQYELAQASTSEDQVTTTTTLPSLATDPKALIDLLRRQAMLPPKPIVRINCTHRDYDSSWAIPDVEFDLTLNLMALIAGRRMDLNNDLLVVSKAKQDSSDNGAGDCKKQGGLSVEELVRRFCDDPAKNKRFYDFSYRDVSPS